MLIVLASKLWFNIKYAFSFAALANVGDASRSMEKFKWIESVTYLLSCLDMNSNLSLLASSLDFKKSLFLTVCLSNLIIGRIYSPPVLMLYFDTLRPIFSKRLGILLFENCFIFGRSLSVDFLPEHNESTDVLVIKSKWLTWLIGLIPLTASPYYFSK